MCESGRLTLSKVRKFTKRTLRQGLEGIINDLGTRSMIALECKRIDAFYKISKDAIYGKDCVLTILMARVVRRYVFELDDYSDGITDFLREMSE